MYQHMLIDSRNAIYRAIYAGLGDKNFKESGQDFSVIFFRFIGYYLSRFRSDSVHFFWDAPKKTIWRRSLLGSYKDGRIGGHETKYPDVNIDDLLERCTKICMEIINYCNGRNYLRDNQEADDLIYAFCRYNIGSSMIIISSDGDFKQIPYMFRNVDLYNPMIKDGKILEIEKVNPIEVKSFSGEKADNISGYPQIGPVRALKLATDSKFREDFFNLQGRKRYLLNRALIDLSLCPYQLANIMPALRFSFSQHWLKIWMVL